MGLSKTFKTDKSAESEGVWVEYSANDDGSFPAFKIARAGGQNKSYQKKIEQVMKPHRAELRNETMDDKLAEKLYKSVFVETVLLDWRNVTLADVSGNEDAEGFVDCTYDNAVELFDNLPELYADLNEKASKVSTYLKSNLEEDVKN